jgi:hypothetical protein
VPKSFVFMDCLDNRGPAAKRGLPVFITARFILNNEKATPFSNVEVIDF